MRFNAYTLIELVALLWAHHIKKIGSLQLNIIVAKINSIIYRHFQLSGN